VPPRPEGKGFYQYLGALLGAPTDTLSVEDLDRVGRGPEAPTALPGTRETLEAWRTRHRALVASGGTAEEGLPGGDGAGERDLSRFARRHAAAVDLTRAALLRVDLGRPADASLVVTALGARRGARPEVVAEATRLLGRVLATPVIERARRASWLARDVPVAVEVAGAVTEDRLDILFEEPGGLVVLRVETDARDAVSPGLPPEALAAALGRPVLEMLTLSLS
jgi:hypothetical protein